MGIFQICMIEELRFTPSFDLDAIYGGAIQWVETGTFADYYDYFDWFPNNLGGLCYYYILFKVCSVFSRDYFFIAACANEVLILSTFAFIILSVEKLWGRRYGLIAMALTGCLPPLLFMTDVFYTDSLSILFPILLFYLSLRIDESSGVKSWKLCVFSGLVAVLGIFIKATVLIMVAAVCLSFCLRKKWKKALIYILPFMVIYTVFTFAVQGCLYSRHLDPELAEVKNTPYYHWVMMGLEGEGAYNPGDYEFTRSFTDPQERDNALRKEIINRISEKGVGGMAQLYKAKIIRCIGNGTLGLSDFLDDNPKAESPLHQYILYSGSKYESYKRLCNIVFYSLLLLAAFYPVRSGRKETEGFAPALALCGIIVFLMHWETSPRYITNYVPVIILLAAGGVRGLLGWIEEKGIDKKISGFMRKYKKEVSIVGKALCFRIAVSILFACIMEMCGNYEYGITVSDFLEGWTKGNAAYYVNIAQNGYAGAMMGGEHISLVFYPLYPWLIKMLAFMLNDYRLGGILISTVCYAVGCVFFYKITEAEMGDKAAENALLLISVFPYAFFFGGIAVEALLFAVVSAFFYYLRKHNWKRVALLGFFACLTGGQGIILFFSVLAELLDSEKGILLLKERKWADFGRKIIHPCGIVCTMFIGFVIYLLINHAVEGNPFQFIYYRNNYWNDGFRLMRDTMIYGGMDEVWASRGFTGISLKLLDMLPLVYIVVFYYGRKGKMRCMYMTYLVSVFLQTWLSSSLMNIGQNSLYVLPIFMLGGNFISKNEKWKMPVLILSSMLMVVYMTGYFCLYCITLNAA